MTTTSFLPFLLIGLSAVTGAHALDGAALPSPIREPVEATQANDVWLISTRHLPCPQARCGPPDGMTFKRLNGCHFVPASKDEFVQSIEPSQVTCFFIHGNRMSVSDARKRGQRLRRLIDRGQAPYRYVIWSWPSDKIPGPIRDARSKARRADCESYYLAGVLSEMPADANVSLIGFSFGTRTIVGSLQLLGGGIFNGNLLALPEQPTVRPRVVLLASAVPRRWLLPSGATGLAPRQVEQLFVFYNPRDAALKSFPVVFHPSRPTALGLNGIAARQLGPASASIHQYNVTRLVGHSHRFSRYAETPWIMESVGRFALGSPSP